MASDGSSSGGSFIGGVIGAVIGFVVGGPAGAVKGFMYGSTIGGLLAPPTGPDQFGPRLDSLKITTSSNTATLPRAYGKVAHNGNIIWAKGDEYVELTTVKKVKTGFFSKTKVTTYTYFFTGAIAFARSEAKAFFRVWHKGGNELVYNSTSTDPDTQIANGEFLKYVTFYYGTADQEKDPLISESENEIHTSPYRGVIYLVYNMYPLANYNNSIGGLDPKIEYTTVDTEISDLDHLADIPADSEGTDQDLHDALHNATNLNADGVNLWRIGRPISPIVNYTETSDRFHYVANPNGTLALKQVYAENDVIADELYHPYTRACHGKSDRNVFLSTKGYIRQGAPGIGGSLVHPSLLQVGQWAVQLVPPGWGTPLLVAVNSLYDGIAYVLTRDGPGIAGSEEYMFDSGEQISNEFGIFWRDPGSQLPRYVIYSAVPVHVPLPITSAMYFGDGNYYFVRFELSVLDEDNDTDLKHIIHVDASTEIPSATTHYAFHNNITFFLYTYSTHYVIVRINELGGRRYQEHTLTSETVVKMGILNDELIVVVTNGTNCNFDIYDIEDLELDDNKDSAEIITLFGASTSAFYNSLSFDYDKVFYAQSGSLKVKASFDAAAENLGTHTGLILGTESPSLFNMWKAGSLIANSTKGGTMDEVGIQFFSYGVATDPGKIPLADIIVAENTLVGIESSDLDVTTIDQLVRGYICSEIGPPRRVLEQLQAIFPWDVIQHGYKNKYVKRGSGTEFEVPWQDLGPVISLAQEREMDTQLPYRLEITYFDIDLDGQPNIQFAERRFNSKRIERLNIPLFMNAAEAAQAAEVLLNIRHDERRSFVFTLPPTYRNAEPSDLPILNMKDATHRMRLENVNYLSNGQLECTAKQFRVTTYTSAAPGASGSIPKPTTIPSIANPFLGVLDAPVIHDSQNKPGYLSLVAHPSDTWIGGTLWRARDGVTYEMVQALSAVTVWGTCQNALTAHGGHLVDEGSELICKPIKGEIVSVTETEWMNEETLMAYGAPGRWELIAPQLATDNADGTFSCSRFLRGRRGTEWASSLHQIGDYFGFVNDGTAKFVSALVTDIDQTLKHKAVTTGRDLESASVVNLLYAGENLKPRSPVQASGYRDSNDDFFGRFIPRSRLNNRLSPLQQITDGSLMGEATELYEIDVMDGADVLRTITVTVPEFEYPAADQVTDFGSEQSAIDFNIYQISAVVGRGHVGVFTL